MHYLPMASSPVDVPVLSSRPPVIDLAMPIALFLWHSSHDLMCECCTSIGMIVSVSETKVLMFDITFPGPFQWSCRGEQLKIVIELRYLGILFNVLHGTAVLFPMLKQPVWGMGFAQAAVWALTYCWPQLVSCLECVRHVSHQH